MLSTGTKCHRHGGWSFEVWQDEPKCNGPAAWHHHGKDGDQVSGTHSLHGSCFLEDNSGIGKKEREVTWAVGGAREPGFG